VRLRFLQESLQKRLPGGTPQLQAECPHFAGMDPLPFRVSAMASPLKMRARKDRARRFEQEADPE
jgi:hypothetical protein